MRKYKWNRCHQYDGDDDDDEEAGKRREGAEDATKSVMSHVLVNPEGTGTRFPFPLLLISVICLPYSLVSRPDALLKSTPSGDRILLLTEGRAMASRKATGPV